MVYLSLLACVHACMSVCSGNEYIRNKVFVSQHSGAGGSNSSPGLVGDYKDTLTPERFGPVEKDLHLRPKHPLDHLKSLISA